MTGLKLKKSVKNSISASKIYTSKKENRLNIKRFFVLSKNQSFKIKGTENDIINKEFFLPLKYFKILSSGFNEILKSVGSNYH